MLDWLIKKQTNKESEPDTYIIPKELNIVDFHSHILPGMDDGSESVEESMLMLRAEKDYGVDAVVASPHFYPNEENPESFLSRRDVAVNNLLKEYDAEVCPKVYAGAEVAYYDNIGHSDLMEKLCIGGTRAILIEMPFARWSPAEIDNIVRLRDRYNLVPIIAHIERYMRWQSKKTFEMLRYNDIIIQSNADFFIDKSTQKEALKMISEGRIHLLGSDSHNMTSRKPNIAAAVHKLVDVLGEDDVRHAFGLGKAFLHDAKPITAVPQIVNQ